MTHPAPATVFALALTLPLTLAACIGNMEDQPRYDPLEASAFFDDGRSARMIVEGTVPRSVGRLEPAVVSGTDASGPVTRVPVPLTGALLRVGQSRFDIYCAPCHGRTGLGDGMIVRRGFRRPPSYFEPRLLAVTPGYIYDVLVNGFGAMPPYAGVLAIDERWAVVAYVQALQRLGTPPPTTGAADAPAASSPEVRR